MTIHNNKSFLDHFRCCCCKKKEKTIRRYSEAKIDVVAHAKIENERRARLKSDETIQISEALAWDGRYSIKQPTNKSMPLNLVIANFDPPKT